MGIFSRRRQPKPASVAVSAIAPFDLGRPLLALSAVDAISGFDACENTIIFGNIGSGKSSASGALYARSMLSAGWGMLVLCPKPDDAATWLRYAREEGREGDIIHVRPGGPWRFNPLLWEQRRDGRGANQIENLVKVIAGAVEIARGKVQSTGDDSQWVGMMQEMLRNGISLAQLAGKDITIDLLRKLFTAAPKDDDAVVALNEAIQAAPPDDPGYWRGRNPVAALFYEAERRLDIMDLPERERMIAEHEIAVCIDYFTQTWPGLSDRTRSSILVTFSYVADILSHGDIWELISTDCTFTPLDAIRDGRVILLDIDYQSFREVSRIACGMIKTAFQQAILRRDVAEYPRPVGIHIDEFHLYVQSFDFIFTSTCRSARGAATMITQSVAGLEEVIGQKTAASLIQNAVTRIVHSTSGATAEFMANEIGKTWQRLGNRGLSLGPDGRPQLSSTESMVFEYQVPPQQFGDLARGGPHGFAEAIVFKAGHTFKASGANWLRVCFPQT